MKKHFQTNKINNIKNNFNLDAKIETLVNVRGVENLTATAKETNGLFELETKIADLLIDIKKGEKDV